MLALTWGAAGVPVIMVSGDDRLERELRGLPWIEYVTVKKSITARTVELRDVDEVHVDLEEAAARAVQRLGRAAVVRITLPAEVTVRAGPPSSLALLDGVPGVAYSDGGVTFRAGRLDEVWAGVNALVRLAVIEFTTIRSEVLSNHPAGPEIQQRFVEALGSRALEVAEGRYVQPTDGERPSPFSFFGVQ